MNNTWFYSDQNYFVFRAIIDQLADHVMITNKHGFIEYVNPAFEKTTGYSKEEVLGENPRFLKSGRQSMDYYHSLWRTILSGNVFYAKTVNKKKNGQIYVAGQTISPILNELKEITHFVSVWRDVTDAVKIEERIKFEKEKLEEIIGFDVQLSRFKKSDQLVDFVVSKIRKILKVSKCSVMLVDKTIKHLYTKSMDGFTEDIPMDINISGSIAESVVLEGQPLLVNDLDKDLRFKELKQPSYLGQSFMIVPIKHDEEVIGIINVADKSNDYHEKETFDIVDTNILIAIATEMAVAIENISFTKELHYLTIIDPLTHIHNYRHFVNCLDYEIKRLRRKHEDLCLLMLDVDSLKTYNDTLGHLEGDTLLKELSLMVHMNLREIDVFCRYGGDEFVIILPGTNTKGAVIVAEKIRKSIEMGKFQKTVTVSIGVAQYKDKMTRFELTTKADNALYKAKEQGRNRVVY